MSEETIILPEDVQVEVIDTKRYRAYTPCSGTKCEFRTEYEARWHGSTHIICRSCGEVRIQRSLGDICPDCQKKEDLKSRDAADVWNGKSPLNAEEDNHWFWLESDIVSAIAEYCLDKNMDISDLVLCSSRPEYAASCCIDTGHFLDILAEDADIPEPLYQAMKAFNRALVEYTEPVSWWSAEITRLPPEMIEQIKLKIEELKP